MPVPQSLRVVYDPSMRCISIALVSCLLVLAACDDKGTSSSSSTTSSSTSMPSNGSASPAKESGAATAMPPPPALGSVSASANVAVAGAASGSSSAAAGGHPATCEVEIFGDVVAPKEAVGKLVVYVSQGDCLASGAEILGHIPASPSGSFVIEVFPKWGSDLTICAGAVPDGKGAAATYYGKAVSKTGKFHAEAEGEVTFNDVKIPLVKGPPIVFHADSGK